jgi:hypothetical protein
MILSISVLVIITTIIILGIVESNIRDRANKKLEQRIKELNEKDNIN